MSFEIGNFYGLTGPLAVLVNERDFQKMIDDVGSATSFNRLRDLGIELEVLDYVFNRMEVFQSQPDAETLYTLTGGMNGKFDNGLEMIKFNSMANLYFHTNPEETEYKGVPKIVCDNLDVAISDISRVFTGRVMLDGEVYSVSGVSRDIVDVIFRKVIQDKVAKKYKEIIDNHMLKFGSKERTFLGKSLRNINNYKTVYILNHTLNQPYIDRINSTTAMALPELLESINTPLEIMLYDDEQKSLTVTPFNFDKEMNIAEKELYEEFKDKPVFPEIFSSQENVNSILRMRSIIGSMNGDYWRTILNDSSLTDKTLTDSFIELQDYGLIGLYVNPRAMFDYSLNAGVIREEVPSIKHITNDLVRENLEIMRRDMLSKMYALTERGVVRI